MRRSAIINIMITSSGNKRDNNDIVNKCISSKEREREKECNWCSNLNL